MDTADDPKEKATSTMSGSQVEKTNQDSRSSFDTRSRGEQCTGQKDKATSAPQGTRHQLAKSSSANVERTLKQAGAAQPPALSVGPILKHLDVKERKAVDYWQETFLPLTLRVIQPRSCHLHEALAWPKAGCIVEPHTTPANLMVHIRGLAQGGRQHCKYRNHHHWLRDWDDCHKGYAHLGLVPVL